MQNAFEALAEVFMEEVYKLLRIPRAIQTSVNGGDTTWTLVFEGFTNEEIVRSMEIIHRRFSDATSIRANLIEGTETRTLIVFYQLSSLSNR